MKIAPLLFASMVLAGCSSNSSGPQSPAPWLGTPAAKTEQPGKEVNDKRVTMDRMLNGIIRVVKIQDMPANQGFLRFQVNLLNLSTSAKTIIYEVDWLDDKGMSLGISMDEPPATLFRGETYIIALASPSAAAKDFHITFKPRT